MPFDRIEVKPGLLPMEAKLVDALPDGAGWRFEPKWDGFRCIVFRDGADVELQSKSGKPLGRYFPEVVEVVGRLQADRFVIDGELVIPSGDRLDFEALQMRLHPAESRIHKLSAATPAQLVLFDCLAGPDGRGLVDLPLVERREALEAFHEAQDEPSLLLSPFTGDGQAAQGWLDQVGTDLDGVIAKREDGPYVSGERVMLKIKCMRTADCVVGGFRYAAKGGQVGSLLLGLYNDEGKLDHVGFTSAIPAGDKAALTERLEALIEAPGFTGDAPGGPSRWATERSTEWQPLRPELIAEVRYDHVTGRRFRHGTKFLRWRPDKAPEQCRMDQLQAEARPDALAGALERPK
jgi:ATP-dependent DNA ligase